jgi:hypothetical protein
MVRQAAVSPPDEGYIARGHGRRGVRGHGQHLTRVLRLSGGVDDEIAVIAELTE